MMRTSSVTTHTRPSIADRFPQSSHNHRLHIRHQLLVLCLTCMGSLSSKSPSGGPAWQDKPAPPPPEGHTISLRATLGAGCYWGTEKYVKNDWNLRTGAVTRTAVGFMGPSNAIENPTYRQVCSGNTGHVEVLDVEFQATKDKSAEQVYEDLIRFFFQFHDPTTLNRQGNDAGTQYASVIFCYDDKQMEIANKVKAELQGWVGKGRIKGYFGKEVTTAIHPATTFYAAHEAHQDYLNKNPGGYCNHRIRFKTWPRL